MKNMWLVALMMLFPSTGWAYGDCSLSFGWFAEFYRWLLAIGLIAMGLSGVAMVVSYQWNRTRKLRNMSYVTRVSGVVGVLMLILVFWSFGELGPKRYVQSMRCDDVVTDVSF